MWKGLKRGYSSRRLRGGKVANVNVRYLSKTPRFTLITCAIIINSQVNKLYGRLHDPCRKITLITKALLLILFFYGICCLLMGHIILKMPTPGIPL